MRGVHPNEALQQDQEKGSSPHARGPPGVTGVVVVIIRIIPACAGSTFLFNIFSCHFQDHPRMRGVHIPIAGFICRLQGSSPHARGPLISHDYHSFCIGIIPACAGSTGAFYSIFKVLWDHPRMRGVHCILYIFN